MTVRATPPPSPASDAWRLQARRPDGSVVVTSSPYPNSRAADEALDFVGVLSVFAGDPGRTGPVTDTTLPADRACDCLARGTACHHFEVEGRDTRGPTGGVIAAARSASDPVGTDTNRSGRPSPSVAGPSSGDSRLGCVGGRRCRSLRRLLILAGVVGAAPSVIAVAVGGSPPTHLPYAAVAPAVIVSLWMRHVRGHRPDR